MWESALALVFIEDLKKKKKRFCPPMICAQRLLRRARAMDEEEMMEIHLENQMGKNKNSASNTGT